MKRSQPAGSDWSLLIKVTNLFCLFLSLPEVRIVMQHHVQQGIVDFQASVIFDEAELAKLVHEHAYAGPRGSDHLGKRLLAYLPDDRLRLTLLTEVRHQEEHPRQTLLA